MRYRPFPTEEDLASLDEEALKAAAEAADDKEDEEGQGWLGEVELSKISFALPMFDDALSKVFTYLGFTKGLPAHNKLITKLFTFEAANIFV